MISLDHFDTARLTADRVRASDFDQLCEMNANPEVMKTLGGPRSVEKTRESLRSNLEHWERYGFGLWVLRSREGQAFVGRSAIRHIDVEGSDQVELGYALMPAFWRCGLATEVTQSMLNLARSHLGFVDLIALALPDNAASRRVIQKCGGQHERDVDHAGQLHGLYRFRVADR